VNISEIDWISKQRLIFEKKKSLFFFYECLFNLLRSEIKNFDAQTKIVEIGTGAGFSTNFLKEFKYLKTDAIDTGIQDALVDAQDLPFDDDSLDVIFGIDVFHHISRPFQFLEEVSRCLKQDGRLILIEPAITPFSWPVYKFLHPEPMKWRVAVTKDFQFSGSNVMDANNALPSLIFKNNSEGSLESFELRLKYETRLFGFISMLATGGINNSWSIPVLNRYIKNLFNWELRRSRKFGNTFFLRSMIVIEKF
jgi:SAM-dependent methyltransferase